MKDAVPGEAPSGGDEERRSVPAGARWLLVVALAALVLVPLLAIGQQYPQLIDLSGSPRAGSGTRVLEAVSGESEAARALGERLVDGLWWDSFFVLVYGTTIALSCLLPTRRLVRYRWAGRVLAGFAGAAALADLVENHAVAVLLDRSGGSSTSLPAVGSPAELSDWLRMVLSDAAAAQRVEYAGAAKLALVASPAVFAVGALVAWALGQTERSTIAASRVRDAILAARQSQSGQPEGHRLVLGRRLPALVRARRWLVGDEPPALRLGPPDTIRARCGVGVCFSGGGIRSAAYNLGALQELQAGGVLNRAEYLAAVSGGSYIASAYSLVATESSEEALGSMPPFAPGSPEEQHLRNRTSYLVPGPLGFLYALWRLARGVLLNLVFIGLVLFLLARPYGWALQDRFPLDQGRCRVEGVVAVGAPDVVPAGEAERVLNQQSNEGCSEVTFRVLPWAVVVLGVLAGLAVVLGVFDVLLRPRDGAARRLERWSYRLLMAALVVGIVLFAVPRLVEVLLDRPTWLREPGANAVRWFGALGPSIGALASLVVAGATLAGGGPGRHAGSWSTAEATSGLATRARQALGRLATGTRAFVLVLVGAVIAPLAFVAGAVAFAYGGVLARFSAGDVALWLLACGAFVLIQGVGDLNRWSLHPYYKRRLQSAFAVQRVCQGGTAFAEEIPFDREIPFSDLLDSPKLLICAAVNVTDYGLLPPGRPVSTFTFCRDEIDAGVLGHSKIRHLATLLGSHHRRDFTVPAAVAASGAAFSPVMGKMTRAHLRFIMALVNLRLGVWLPNPLRVQQWAASRRVPEPLTAADESSKRAELERRLEARRQDLDEVLERTRMEVTKVRRRLQQEVKGSWGRPDPSTSEIARRRRVASREIAEAESGLLQAKLAMERERRKLEAHDDRVGSEGGGDFLGFPGVARPTLIFREMLGRFRATSRFVYVTDGGHYENLGLVELVRRGCREIYCFDAAGDQLDAFTTLADAATIAETELGVRIDVDPKPIGTPAEGHPNGTDHVTGLIWYPDAPDDPGRIVFAKAAVTPELPPEVRSWHKSNPGFPTEGTDDQLYTDQRFEAYRALGAHTAVRAIASMDRLFGRFPIEEQGPRRLGAPCRRSDVIG